MSRLPKLGQVRPDRNSSDDPEEFRLSMAEHLEELRVRIFRMLLILSAGFVIGWVLSTPVYQALSHLVNNSFSLPKGLDYKEPFRSVTEPFMLKLKMAFYIGLILTLPFLVLQLWGFVKPGLKPQERKPLRFLAPVSLALFLLGAALCWLVLPSAFAWFLSYADEFPGTAIYQEPGTLIFFILKMILAFGIGFQLPVVVFFLSKVGLLSESTLSQYWRQVTVGVFFTSALLTPSADLFSMLMMAVPLTLLFFGSMFAVKFTNRRRALEYDEDAVLPYD